MSRNIVAILSLSTIAILASCTGLSESSGAMLVSSNAQPWIWRVGPERFEVERIEIRLEDASGRDVGFSALAWSGEGNALDAVDAATRAPWRIDLVSRKATRLSPGAGASSC